MFTRALLATIALATLAACGGGGNPFDTPTDVTTPGVSFPDVGRATQIGDGPITVNQAARAVVLPATPLTTTVVTSIAEGSTTAHAVSGINALAVGGVSDGAGFAGITATFDADQPGKNATFSGTYGVTTLTGQSEGLIELEYTFADQSLRSVGGPLAVSATASGPLLSGTVTFAGEDAVLSGGFFGQDQLAGAFNGDTMGGVILASE